MDVSTRILIACLLAVTCQHIADGHKILLRDINTVTLRKGQWTSARRSSAVPQLKCTGGTAGCYAFIPEHVQCYNKGWDGYDVQWECKTDMDSKYRFGELAVSCEGYDYADDPHVLAGSCGLEYAIDYVNQKNTGSYWGGSGGGGGGNSHSNNQTGSGIGSIVGFIFIVMIIFFVYRTCFATEIPPYTGQSATAGGTPGGSNPSAPPPPYGFRSDYTEPQCSNSAGYSSTNANNGQPGFFSGMFTGGLLGYLLGNRGNYGANNGYYSDGYRRDWFGSPSYPNTGFGSSGFSSGGGGGGSRTASGFGGTKRR